MKETARPDPLAAAHRVKDLARDLAGEVADGYRKSSRYLKLRAAIVGTWALLSVVTFWAACPSSGSTNALGAQVQVAEELIGTQVSIWNGSDQLWTDVVLTLDGEWRYATRTVRAGERLVLATTKFTKEGVAAPRDLKPRAIAVECEQGRVNAPLAARAP